MPIQQVDIKLLWGRAGAMCSMCKRKLTQVAAEGATNAGWQAHIVGDNKGSARYESVLSEAERDRYANLILLCGACHDEIDKLKPLEYPVEKLHEIKTSHELWVEEKLSAADRTKEANDIVYAQCADMASNSLQFADWHNWTFLLLQGNPKMHGTTLDGLVEFTAFMIRVPLPGKIDLLERSMAVLGTNVEILKRVFQANCFQEGEALQGHKAYSFAKDHEERERLGAFYNDWCKSITSAVVHLTRSANHFADQVRDSINPMYFLEEGRFMIELGNWGIDSYHNVPEFDEAQFIEEEKSAPDRLKNVLDRIGNQASLVDLWPYTYGEES